MLSSHARGEGRDQGEGEHPSIECIQWRNIRWTMVAGCESQGFSQDSVGASLRKGFDPATFGVPVGCAMRKPFNLKSPAESFHQPGLEYWFKERRTLVDSRRGPLGRYFDGFAAFLKAKGYSHHGGSAILGRCCQSNVSVVESKPASDGRIKTGHLFN
jgi:hypothetical protein